MRVLVTGGSGLLGRAILPQFKSRGANVLGLAYSRSGGDLKKVDITDSAAVEAVIQEFKPDVVIHAAAECKVEVAEKDPERARKVNVEATSAIARVTSELGIFLLYISTEYVFDGNAPDEGYDVDAKTNPLNQYAKLKRDGEDAVLAYKSSNCVSVVRVPLLYGEANSNSESAANLLATPAQNPSVQTKMDDYATRYPTAVQDVARVLYDISARALETKAVPPILHFSAQTCLTKYEMACIMAELFGVKGTDHLLPQRNPPGPNDIPRPRNCHLSNRALQEFGVQADYTDFRAWWQNYIAQGGGRTP